MSFLNSCIVLNYVVCSKSLGVKGLFNPIRAIEISTVIIIGRY
jgi:hypothetical protein